MTDPTTLRLNIDNTLALARGQELPPVSPSPTPCSIKLDIVTDELIVSIGFVSGRRVAPQQLFLTNSKTPSFSWNYDPNAVDSSSGTWEQLIQTVGPGSWIVVNSGASGSLIGVYQLTSDAEQMLYLTCRSADFVPANFDAPPLGSDYNTSPSPQLPVVVNWGSLYQLGDQLICTCIHEQFWQLGGVTATLAPGETRTVGYVTTVGRLDSTTDQESVQKSLSATISGSASWGWGSISASVSAALSESSTTTHTTSITTSEVVSIEQVLSNSGEQPVAVLEWQLVDRYVVIVDNAQQAVIDAAQAGSVVQMVPPGATLAKAPG
jgi:hypothetical protein